MLDPEHCSLHLKSGPRASHGGGRARTTPPPMPRAAPQPLTQPDTSTRLITSVTRQKDRPRGVTAASPTHPKAKHDDLPVVAVDTFGDSGGDATHTTACTRSSQCRYALGAAAAIAAMSLGTVRGFWTAYRRPNCSTSTRSGGTAAEALPSRATSASSSSSDHSATESDPPFPVAPRGCFPAAAVGAAAAALNGGTRDRHRMADRAAYDADDVDTPASLPSRASSAPPPRPLGPRSNPPRAPPA